ncbi:hypothetical protein [Pseudobacteroides cellulosolvens]|uniref:Zinc-finger domain-containing protein n=1 Tax=Pseudobacteroides cellulosolvens ATCC 35603 = DSM 2933 TaxID=398512 RepID=A0A0L6JJE3_9FIRM|nr:hypothetical protein [Pseudobacteroides cellulosolvens]KNY25542.1 hypothetical protein Bccel_0802 [Pseudobacteroides cellulosolvens ATCC 35603 = DSM 2933]
MNCDTFECIDQNILEDYYLQKLDLVHRGKIEEHLCNCEKCIDKARRVSSVIERHQIIKANPILGLAWKTSSDYVMDYKCADDGNKSIKEFKTANKKYHITLRPIEENKELSLMEIKVLDPSIQGNLIVYTGKFREKVEIDKDGLACLILSSNVDLSQLIIRNDNL